MAGCGDSVADLKEAAAGINSKANEGASAISIDVHSISATEIEFDNQTFTINDVFKVILRDVQWDYDDSGETRQLKITGTWQDNGLFAEHSFSARQKETLSLFCFNPTFLSTLFSVDTRGEYVYHLNF